MLFFMRALKAHANVNHMNNSTLFSHTDQDNKIKFSPWSILMVFVSSDIFFSHSLLLLLVGVLTFKSIRAPEFFWKLEFFKSIATIANFFRQSRKESNITLFCEKSYESVMPSIHVHQPECKELDMVINTTQFQIWISHKQYNYYIFNLFWNNLKD